MLACELMSVRGKKEGAQRKTSARFLLVTRSPYTDPELPIMSLPFKNVRKFIMEKGVSASGRVFGKIALVLVNSREVGGTAPNFRIGVYVPIVLHRQAAVLEVVAQPAECVDR